MDKNFIEDAYRKLKGSVYLDKSVPFLRTRIVEFEKENIDEKLDYINEALNDEEKFKKLETSILNSINVLTMPKKIQTKSCDESKHNPIVISNISETNIVVEKYNNFIDMSVEGHLIGILWILTIGYKMDKNLYANCYGNRLNNNLIFDNQRLLIIPYH